MTTGRIPCSRLLLQATRRRQRFHTTPLLWEDAAAAEVVPPPIVWTTHRLNDDQISKVDAVFHKILWLDAFEMGLLTASINWKLGRKITPAQQAAIQRQIQIIEGTVGGAPTAASKEEEDAGPKLVSLQLKGFDAKAKIKVIKEVRAIAGLGLKESKELVEKAPTILQKDLSPESAEELKAKLEAVGATVELV